MIFFFFLEYNFRFTFIKITPSVKYIRVSRVENHQFKW